MHRLHRFAAVLATALLAGALMVAATPAGAAPPTAVDFTIEESLTVTTGTLYAGVIEGCDTPIVTTENFRAGGGGVVRTFAGDKVFDCGGGDSFTLSFSARVRDCSATDRGSWRVVAGTGAFAGLRGNGSLVGTYVGGDSCGPTGILDNYTGRFFLP